MVHTGGRPHTCDVCGKVFIQKSDMLTHRRKYHHIAKKYLVNINREPDDNITKYQMSGQKIEHHLADVKSEPDDIITEPQMSGQKTEHHLVDVKSEPDDITTQPQMSGQETKSWKM